MCEESIQANQGDEERKLICSGIWGGIRDLDQDVGAGAVVASLYSSSCDGGKGGDIYYFGVCKGDMITRVAIADVVGHGQTVSDVSQCMYDSLKAHMCDPDHGSILSKLNELASGHGLQAMTTAAVVAYYASRAAFYISCAGHPPALFKHTNEETWTVAKLQDDPSEGHGLGTNLPLAVAPEPFYDQQVVPATSGDRFFVYTDGVTEARNVQGELFGIGGLKSVLDANADAPLSLLKSAVLQALYRHTGNGLTHDDVTLIAMEVR